MTNDTRQRSEFSDRRPIAGSDEMKSIESARRKNGMRSLAALLTMSLGWMGSACAQEPAAEAATSEDAPTKLIDGSYISPMATGVFQTNKTRLDDGYGGTLALGWRSGFYGFEIAPAYADLDNAKMIGAAINGLLYPFKSLPNLYATVGLSGMYYHDYKTRSGDKIDYNTVNVDGGLGYLFPLSSGRYDWAIRTEARYRVGRRERDYNDLDIDIDAPRRFREAIVNIGLYLPIGLRPVPPPAPPPAVVVPASTCGDGLDNDGDGVIDFPADPGCSSLDDTDETDPPRCVAPKPGEKLSLRGCGTGDVIILRGVNFEFDMDRLTPDAQTILDGVADELTAYPDIQVELGGHTDAVGSDEYNQKLSERRAQAVADYLAGKGIAASRMTSVGYGEAQPVADNETDEGREMNRRTELKVTGGTASVAGSGASTQAAEPPTAAPMVDAPPVEPAAVEP